MGADGKMDPDAMKKMMAGMGGGGGGGMGGGGGIGGGMGGGAPPPAKPKVLRSFRVTCFPCAVTSLRQWRYPVYLPPCSYPC